MTETTQPDPQVVAWMRGHREARPLTNRALAVRAWLAENSTDGTIAGASVSMRELCDAYDEAARKPLTVPDVPAGQGPASLFILSDDDGQPGVWHKDSDGRVHAVHRRPFPHYAGDDALWDHLAATLPHVTTETAP